LAEPAAPCTVTVAVFEAATAWVSGALSADVAIVGSDRTPHVTRAWRAAAVAEWSRVMLDSLTEIGLSKLVYLVDWLINQ
jgi:endonuclease V-like protein UPF0215 family